MIIAETVLKSAYEVLVLPVTTFVVRYIKRTEQTDVYDETISYNVLKITDIYSDKEKG